MDENKTGCNHEHDCNCDHDHEQYMTLMLEDGSSIKCAVIGIFDVEEIAGKEYIALVPDDGEEVYLYEYIEVDNEEGFELKNIDDDKEFEIVEEAFMNMIDDELEDDELDEYEFEDADDAEE